MSSNNKSWAEQDWKLIHYRVRKIQGRIAAAAKRRDWKKVRELQNLVYHSWYCRMAAVRRVTSRKNVRTPGIDGKFWFSDEERFAAVESLNYRTIKPRPWKRIYIQKDHDKSKFRPLSVPVIKDRAFEGLLLIAMDPVVETLADAHSYGFRKHRSSQDVVKDIMSRFGFDRGNVWVLKADIKECFDHLSHDWILNNAPAARKILRPILQCGYYYKGEKFPTTEGVPQGGVVSPLFTTLLLCGFEDVLKRKYPGARLEMIRFVDDFLFASDDKDLLGLVRADLAAWLSERGLWLSENKTFITHINNGVDYIGWHFQRSESGLIVSPTEQSVRELFVRLEGVVFQAGGWTCRRLIRKLNGMVLGWGSYHVYLCTVDCFTAIDTRLQDLLWEWAVLRHPTHSYSWVYAHYWHYDSFLKRRVFSSGDMALLRFADTSVRIAPKLDLTKNPYLDVDYFKARRKAAYYADKYYACEVRKRKDW